jgi:hypothetical protein
MIIIKRKKHIASSIKRATIKNDFQFETYTVGSKADMALYKERVLPVLNDWESEVGNYEVASELSE